MPGRKKWSSDSGRTKLTPPEVAQLWGVSVGKVMTWIRNGELRAINVAQRLGGRPRYRIDVADLTDFENRRAYQPNVPVPRRPRKRRDDYVYKYF
jgi:excisionase family DNA binding protein